MTIHAPGRIQRGLPLFDAPRRRRSSSPSLSMTSMIDVLVVLTVFLLLTFSPNDACGCIEKKLQLPRADGIEMIDAPMITVVGSEILVDGYPIAATEVFESKRTQRIDALYNHLRAKHEQAKLAQPGRPAPDTVVLRVDVDVPSSVVKSVVQTSATAGYPQISFLVEAR